MCRKWKLQLHYLRQRKSRSKDRMSTKLGCLERSIDPNMHHNWAAQVSLINNKKNVFFSGSLNGSTTSWNTKNWSSFGEWPAAENLAITWNTSSMGKPSLPRSSCQILQTTLSSLFSPRQGSPRWRKRSCCILRPRWSLRLAVLLVFFSASPSWPSGMEQYGWETTLTFVNRHSLNDNKRQKFSR